MVIRNWLHETPDGPQFEPELVPNRPLGKVPFGRLSTKKLWSKCTFLGRLSTKPQWEIVPIFNQTVWLILDQSSVDVVWSESDRTISYSEEIEDGEKREKTAKTLGLIYSAPL